SAVTKGTIELFNILYLRGLMHPQSIIFQAVRMSWIAPNLIRERGRVHGTPVSGGGGSSVFIRVPLDQSDLLSATGDQAYSGALAVTPGNAFVWITRTIVEVEGRLLIRFPLNNGLRRELADLIAAVARYAVFSREMTVTANCPVPYIAGEQDVSLIKLAVGLVGRAQKNFLSFDVREQLAQARKVDLV